MKIPHATYRLQFNARFTFRDARAVTGYLSRLGIGCIYASPVFLSRKGSMHGYDIIDPRALNDEIGSEDDFHALINSARENSLLWLQDIVPNHMSYSGDNKLIIDILENGNSSPYIDYFDIDWRHPYESLQGKLLAPFLGKFFGQSLEDGEIRLAYDAAGLFIGYYDIRLPLRMESYLRVLTLQLSSLKHTMGPDHPDFVRLLGMLYTLKNLPPNEEGREHNGHVTFIKKILWDLYNGSPHIRSYVDGTITALNGKRGDPGSFNLLEKLLAEQLFRLSFWKVAGEEINYRRFFNINELISLRAEDEKVFSYTHELILRLSADGTFSAGVRVDHIDGLYEPEGYLRRLRENMPDACIYVEKILNFGEDLPGTWPVQGTTGYDFLNHINGLFCRPESEASFTRTYTRFIRLSMNYRNMVVDKKRLIIGKYMAGDIDSLAQLMKNISNRYRYGNDITLYGLKRALVDILALFPIYRTYISRERYSETDRTIIARVLDRAKQENPGLLHELSFIEDFLLLKFKEYFSDEDKQLWIHFVMRFQQYTGPLMAKGFEDTVFYVYNRLISLNEVGGNPAKFGVLADDFHRWNMERAIRWPHSLNATATHDTKRGEDARARINVLSEMPEQWRSNVTLWSMLNRNKKSFVAGREIPAKNDEYHLYQTLIGTFPFFDHEYPSYVERIKNYAVKAVREAKIHTAWIRPDEEYENCFLLFIDKILSPGNTNEFLRSFVPFQKTIADYGILNSLSQILLKIASPGVPDFYQGTETWDFSLVDPDNRRPVDFVRLESLLDTLIKADKHDRTALIAELLEHKEDGRLKLFLTYRLLQARRAHARLFSNGDYRPLPVTGKYNDHVIAFLRRNENEWSLTAVPRFMTRLMKNGLHPLKPSAWGDTTVHLPEHAPVQWHNTVTGHSFSAGNSMGTGELFEHFPVCLLTGTTTPDSTRGDKR